MSGPDDSLPLDPLPLDEGRFDPAEWRRSTRALQRIARSVVGDAGRSEDVVQGAWVRALERGGPARRGWLRRFVRHRAVDDVRKERGRPAHGELTADTAESTAATSEEIASRIEVQRILLDAVESLDEPYRVTIYLRYFDGLPVRETAARLGVPPKTVETRQTRALAKLREKLAPRLGDRGGREWAPAIIAFAQPPSVAPVPVPAEPTGAVPAASVPTAAAPIALGLTMKKSALAAAALVLLVSGWFALDALRTAPGGSVDERVESVQVGDAESPTLAEVRGDGDGERAALTGGVEAPEKIALEPAPIPDGGALRVTVRWSDGTAAEGVGVVAVTPWGPTGVRRRERRATDADGLALFEGLPAEAYELVTERSKNEQEAVVTVTEGATEEVLIELEAGLTVVGRVADDDGAPVPGAEIWIATAKGGWTSGAVVARADVAGRFRLRDVPDGLSLGALAAGHLPSALVDLDQIDTTASPVHVDLVVQPGGGALEGTVTDEDGRPVAGAVVVLGTDEGTLEMRFDHTIAETWGVRHTTTDADGAYRLDALAPGDPVLRVRRTGLAQRSVVVEIESKRTTRQDVVLRRGARVTGIVRDGDGAPIEGARIQAFEAALSEAFLQNGQIDYDGSLAQEVALSAADGSYVLEPLPRRAMFLYAMSPRAERRSLDDDTMQFTKVELDLTGDGEHAWDPVLSDGKVISGVVRHRDGTPIENIFVNLTVTEGTDPHGRATYTGDGTFKFIQLPGDAYRVSAQIWELPEGHEEPAQEGVVPGGEPIELVATFDAPVEYEPSRVTVRFVDEANRANGASVGVTLENLTRFSWRSGEPGGDGLWTFELDKPGRHRPIAMVGDRLVAVGEPFDFVPGADVDLGTFVSEPGGALVLVLDRSEEHPPQGIRLNLRHDAYRHGENLDVGGESTVRLESMQPGAGSITVRGKNFVQQKFEYEIVAGQDTVIDVPLEPAAAVPYRIDLPDFDAETSIAVRFVDVADGSIAKSFSLDDARRYRNPIAWNAYLAPGDYRLEVELGDGRREQAAFRVGSLDADDVPTVAVDLR